MKINPEEITSILKKEIERYRPELQVEEEGTILEVGDGIARIYGLSSALAGEMLEFSNGAHGLAFNLEESSIGAVILGEYEDLHEGDKVKRTGNVVRVPVGEALIGRVVDPLGHPLDGKGPVQTDDYRPVESRAPGIADRQSVKEPLQTGIKPIDSMIPIGRGQRELIIGDRGTGKTAIAVDTIINQRGKDVICIYVAIGQKASTVAGVVHRLIESGAMEYTVIVNAPASVPPHRSFTPVRRSTPSSGNSSANAATASIAARSVPRQPTVCGISANSSTPLRPADSIAARTPDRNSFRAPSPVDCFGKTTSKLSGNSAPPLSDIVDWTVSSSSVIVLVASSVVSPLPRTRPLSWCIPRCTPRAFRSPSRNRTTHQRMSCSNWRLSYGKSTPRPRPC